jgi:putative tricarboxylic transport membrane protein
LIASMWIGNLMLLILILPLIGVWVSLLKVPYRVLFPAIMGFAAIGVYSTKSAAVDIYIAAVFGVLGVTWKMLDLSPVPMLLGFVLGPFMEENLRRTLQVSNGSPLIFLQRPISLAFVAVAALLLTAMLLPAVRKKQQRISE